MDTLEWMNGMDEWNKGYIGYIRMDEWNNGYIGME